MSRSDVLDVNLTPLIRSEAKRRRTHDRESCHYGTFPFSTFADPGCPRNYHGAFRDNIRDFLFTFAHRQSHDLHVHHTSCWRINLQISPKSPTQVLNSASPHLLGSTTIPLFFVEQDVQISGSDARCHHCRSAGWEDEMVARRTYQVIIPAEDVSDIGGDMVSEEDEEEVSDFLRHGWRCRVGGPLFLHGVLHCNGYGHLLCVNGREKGSRFAHGRDMVDLWDRLCSLLRAREVSLEDLAKKRRMELRLLHSVAYGEPWFGRWGYKFNRRANDVVVVDVAAPRRLLFTHKTYATAIEAIRGMPLAVLSQLYDGLDPHVLAIVSTYQRLSAGPRMSGAPLHTLGDLLRYMMELRARLPPSSATRTSPPPPPIFQYALSLTASAAADANHPATKSIGNYCSSTPLSPRRKTRLRNEANRGGEANKDAAAAVMSSSSRSATSSGSATPCRWSAKRLELATEVIVEALKNSEKRWMPRQDVRDAARLYIGDTGLLDYVLKTLGNRVVGSYVVRRTVNPISKVLEYSLENLIPQPVASAGGAATTSDASAAGTLTNRDDVLCDLLYIYRNVLERFKPAFAMGATTAYSSACSVVASAIPTAARIILDSTHFVKDYKGEMTRKCAEQQQRWGGRGLDVVDDEDELQLRVMCSVRLRDAATTTPLQQEQLKNGYYSRSLPVTELLVVPPHATIGDLKKEAEKAFRETYATMAELKVESIESLEGVGDEELLFGNIESGARVVAKGKIEGGGAASHVAATEEEGIGGEEVSGRMLAGAAFSYESAANSAAVSYESAVLVSYEPGTNLAAPLDFLQLASSSGGSETCRCPTCFPNVSSSSNVLVTRQPPAPTIWDA